MKDLRFLPLILVVILLSGCAKEKIAPELPPPQSFIMSFDDLWDESPGPADNQTVISYANFLFAAANLYWWNAVLAAQLAIPAAAFMESFNHEAVWDRPSGSWIWSYSITFNDITYDANLHGKYDDDEVSWSMFITKSGGFVDFLWFEGTSARDNSAGSWIISKNPDENIKNPEIGVQFIDIQWNYVSAANFEITYTDIEAGSTTEGSYIHHGITDDPDLDAFYDIYRIWDDNTTNIKWNSEFHYGQVMNFIHYEDPYWHCWNEEFRNIACE